VLLTNCFYHPPIGLTAMKPLFFFLALLATALFSFQPAATSYTVQPAASRLTWTGYAELGSWAPSGTVQLRRGSFEYDGTTLRNGVFEIDLRTIAHENSQLQEHLRGKDFFDVKRFPNAEFRVREAQSGQATGELTVKSQTHPISFPVTLERTGNQLRIRGTATVDRTLFGVRYNSASFFSGLGDQAIRNDFQLAFDLVATSVPQP
jgi:polyisoprenoid-binding protein YceI